ncbi:MAG: ABC transporter permease [Sphaerochaeta associata]|uniref:ABC transporter permease n=1 Tax=Sphaerochaeta associata TaxID=1129264 RepID=UPI002B21C32E|nr:ABC transporter permease [Sphaerochaeta associata]MEA5105845.1 ABC transporter permease [Sphaerochaeta associata]
MKRTILSFAVMIIVILLVSFLLIAMVGSDIPISLASFFRGIGGSTYAMAEVLVRATPLMLAALGVSVGFRTGFLNIGAEGQLYLGAISITWLGMTFPSLPAPLMLLFSLVLGFVGGGFWALIPGLLKAKFGLSEVINTIMLNYIAINLVGILVRTSLKDPTYPYPMSPMLPASTNFLQLLSPTRLHAGLLLALVCAALVYLLMFRTTLGFCMRAVGLNARACQCSGIAVSKYVIISSLISGGLSGLAGVSEIAGLHHRLIEGISPSYGYLAIIVSLLGRNNPVGIVFASLGIAALQVGSMSMQRSSGVPTSIASIIMGLVVIMILSRKSLFRCKEA